MSGGSRVFVVAKGVRVVGYYALAAGGISHDEAPSRFRRNMPDPIPMMILGRLAVDASEQGSGLGKFLLRDALLRFTRASQEIGMAGLLVHAISEEAKRFYLKHGFAEADHGSMLLIARYKDLVV